MLSHVQARPLLDARASGASDAETSLDLGLTRIRGQLTDAGVELPSRLLTWDEIARIADAPNKCFVVDAEQLEEIRVLSDTTNWVRTLLPTSGAPTTLISGIPMHRVLGTDPWADTLLKIKTLAPLTGRVLDTATGLATPP